MFIIWIAILWNNKEKCVLSIFTEVTHIITKKGKMKIYMNKCCLKSFQLGVDFFVIIAKFAADQGKNCR